MNLHTDSLSANQGIVNKKLVLGTCVLSPRSLQCLNNIFSKWLQHGQYDRILFWYAKKVNKYALLYVIELIHTRFYACVVVTGFSMNSMCAW